ncbi:MAG: signal peptidase II [Endomicrobium sp.]|nr:signal peptidase II [Endomicrobium sp.]
MKKPLITGILAFTADQLSKYYIARYVCYASIINIIPSFNFFNITNIYNTGISFSILEGRNLLLSLLIFVSLSILSICFYINKDKFDSLQKYAFCLVIFGGLGNLTDRFFRGAVVDFLDFGINSLRWPSFNVADFCIFAASGLAITDILFFNGNSKGKKAEVR